MRRGIVTVVGMALVAVGIFACSGSRVSDAPRVLCGRPLDPSYRPGYPLVTFPLRSHERIEFSGVGGPDRAYLRVAPGCDHGADVTVTPSGLVAVHPTLVAADGKPIVISFDGGCGGTGTLTAAVQGRVIGTLPITVVGSPCAT